MKRESHTIDRSDQVDSPAQRHLPLVDRVIHTITSSSCPRATGTEAECRLGLGLAATEVV